MRGLARLAVLVVVVTTAARAEEVPRCDTGRSRNGLCEVDAPPWVAPVQPPPPPKGPASVQPRPRDRGGAFAASIGVGPTVRNLFGLGLAGADLRATAGGAWPRFRVGGRLAIFVGSNELGMPLFHVRIGPVAGLQIGRFSGGLGAQLGLLQMRRTTGPYDLSAVSLGVLMWAACDLYRGTHAAVFLELEGSVDGVNDPQDPKAMWSATLLLGMRFGWPMIH